MSPDGYRQLLEHVKATGVNVWVQDGSGVDKLTADSVNVIYRPAPIAKAPPQQAALFMNCLSPAKAKPLQRNQSRRRNRLAVSETFLCGKDTLDLRYLPVAHGILEY